MSKENLYEIYAIINDINHKYYIGQSKNGLIRRKIEHLSVLRRQKHHNIHLQRSWDKYGEENFTFKILESNCQDLDAAEKKWIIYYNSMNTDSGYNMNPGGCISSSKEQYRALMIFDKITGKLSGTYSTAKDCANALGCHSSTISSALLKPHKEAKGHYIRDYVDGIDEIDVRLLQYEKKKFRRESAKKVVFVKKHKAAKLPDRLLAVEELTPIITGELSEDNIQNHGIDLNVIKIQRLLKAGYIPKEGKTILPTYEEIELDENNCWNLTPGAYDITFEQGCDIPSYVMLLIRQRSSLLRNGGIISSSIWDAGFKTDHMGVVMALHNNITIESGARIACIYGHACRPVTQLYDGQWQLDQWREAIKKENK